MSSHEVPEQNGLQILRRDIHGLRLHGYEKNRWSGACELRTILFGIGLKKNMW